MVDSNHTPALVPAFRGIHPIAPSADDAFVKAVLEIAGAFDVQSREALDSFSVNSNCASPSK